MLRRIGRHGFTLIEILVSIVILGIMLFALAAITGFVSHTWVSGIGLVDNYTKARVVLNLLDRDIQMMVMRRDIAAFVDNNGKSACAFYTNVEGAPGSASARVDNRAVSLVQYALVTTATSAALQRLNYGMNFSTGGCSPVAGAPIPTTLSQLSTLGSGIQSENLATGVILFQWQFIDGSGTVLTPPYIPTGSSSTTTTPFSYSFTSPGAASNPRSVIISMLVLNNAGYTMATQNSGTIAAIQALFPAAGLSSSQTYSQYWNSILNPGTGNFGASLPMPIRTGLQVFQRNIPLPITAPSS